MKRYSNKELSSMKPNRFAVDVLREEAKGRDPYQPTTKKLRESIAYLHIVEEMGVSYSLLRQIFSAWEKTNPSTHLSALIVFTADSYGSDVNPNMDLIHRSYIVSSDNQAFRLHYTGMTPNTLLGDCLDGQDRGVRLDRLMAAVNGGKDGWQVENCYLLSPNFCFPSTFA